MRIMIMKVSRVFIYFFIVVFGSYFILSSAFAAGDEVAKNAGIEWTKNFLKKQENRNLDEIEQEIDKVNKDSSITKFDINKAKSRFEDVVFLGDSVTEYLKIAGILDESSVLAAKGEHVNQANKHINEIKSLKPKQVVILYGANDIGAYSPEVFKKEYIKLLKEIKKVDKGVKIYVQAPIPVNEAVASKRDSRINNENIKLYTQKAKEVANSEGATFLSSEGLVTSTDLYEQDGIHFKYGFYKNWLFFLSENI